MAQSDAERMRRSRAHAKGDHSLCDPNRCEQAVTVVFITRGEKLIADLENGLGPEHIVLLQEAGRITDRLDRLHAILEGDRQQWLRFRVVLDAAEDPDTVEVIANVSNVLSESRQQAATLRGLMVEIAKAKAATNDPAEEVTQGGLFDVADELAPRRKGSPT